MARWWSSYRSAVWKPICLEVQTSPLLGLTPASLTITRWSGAVLGELGERLVIEYVGPGGVPLCGSLLAFHDGKRVEDRDPNGRVDHQPGEEEADGEDQPCQARRDAGGVWGHAGNDPARLTSDRSGLVNFLPSSRPATPVLP